jgi:O-antigen/teichoic acid export membrane protein
VHFLSSDELGLWYVYSSIGQIAILLDFGFAPALARNISYVWCGANSLEKENVAESLSSKINWKFMKIVLLTCRYIYITIASIAMLFLLTVGSVYVWSLTHSYDSLIPWVIYTIGLFLNLLYSYYSSFLIGVGAIAELNKASVVSKTIQLVLSISLLLLGFGLLGVSIAYIISGIFVRLLSRYYFYSYQNIGECTNAIKIQSKYRECYKLFKVIWHNASRDGLVTISNFLCTQANVLISSSVIGLGTTGFYGLSMQLSTIISNVSAIPFSTFQPLMQEKAVRRDIQGSMSVFARSLILFLILFIGLSIISILLFPFIEYLKPEMNIDVTLYAAILLYMIMYQIYHLCASYISTFNIIPYNKAFIISSITSAILSYALAELTTIGVYAIVAAPIVVTVAYNLWRWPIYVLRYTNFSMKEFIKIGSIEAKLFIINFIKINK